MSGALRAFTIGLTALIVGDQGVANATGFQIGDAPCDQLIEELASARAIEPQATHVGNIEQSGSGAPDRVDVLTVKR